jgi:hypothetical protein
MRTTDVKKQLVHHLAAATKVSEGDVEAVLEALHFKGTLDAVAKLPPEEQTSLTINNARVAFKLAGGGMAS